MASEVLQFAVKPSESLPSFIAPFGNPVHVASILSEIEQNAILNDESEWLGIDGASSESTPERDPGESPAPGESQACIAAGYSA